MRAAARPAAFAPRMKAYRMAVAALCWLALVLQYWLIATCPAKCLILSDGAFARVTKYFSFFTIECNLLVALAMTLPWLAPKTRAAAFFSRTATRTALAACQIVVGAIYTLLLRTTWSPQGLTFVVDATLHYVMPVLYFIDWLFIPRAPISFRELAAWLVFPFAYAMWSLVHGAATGFYPYDFIDAGKLGYVAVLMNMTGVAIVFVVLGVSLSWIKVARSSPNARRRKP